MRDSGQRQKKNQNEISMNGNVIRSYIIYIWVSLCAIWPSVGIYSYQTYLPINFLRSLLLATWKWCNVFLTWDRNAREMLQYCCSIQVNMIVFLFLIFSHGQQTSFWLWLCFLYSFFVTLSLSIINKHFIRRFSISPYDGKHCLVNDYC